MSHVHGCGYVDANMRQSCTHYVPRHAQHAHLAPEPWDDSESLGASFCMLSSSTPGSLAAPSTAARSREER